MATLAALLKAKQKLMAPRAWHMDAAARRAVGALNVKIDAARVARNEDIARHGTLKVTIPWRRGQWQPGEDYEYEPRVPIYDNSGEEIFSVDAGAFASDVKSAMANELARGLVKAVNMHDKLVAFVQKDVRPCQSRMSARSCEDCSERLLNSPCETLALLKEAKE